MSVTRRTIIIAVAVLTLLVATPIYLRRNSAAKLNPNSPPVAVDDSYQFMDRLPLGHFWQMTLMLMVIQSRSTILSVLQLTAR